MKTVTIRELFDNPPNRGDTKYVLASEAEAEISRLSQVPTPDGFGETVQRYEAKLTAATERERELNHVVDHMVRESGKQIERERVLVGCISELALKAPGILKAAIEAAKGKP